MVMRIATFYSKPDVDEAKHADFRRWMGSQPGMVGGWHVSDPSGRFLSVSVWATREDLVAMRDRQYPGGSLGIKPDEVLICDVVDAFGPK